MFKVNLKSQREKVKECWGNTGDQMNVYIKVIVEKGKNTFVIGLDKGVK